MALDAVAVADVFDDAVPFATDPGDGEELLLPGAFGNGLGDALVPLLVLRPLTGAGNSTVPLVCLIDAYIIILDTTKMVTNESHAFICSILIKIINITIYLSITHLQNYILQSQIKTFIRK